MRMRICAMLLWGTGLAMALPVSAGQASLFIAPAGGIYKAGELFSVLVDVNTGGQAINAATAQINFDNSRLEVSSVGFARSVFSLWTEEPKFSNPAGTIRFSGGLPSPGFTGSSGAIARITFKTIASGKAEVAFVSGSVLANDGKGTNIADNLRGGIFTVTGAEPPKPAPAKASPSQPAPAYQTAPKLVAAPVITEWPQQLEEGSALTIRGLGAPDAKILISVQKGTDDPVTEERFTANDGRFSYNFNRPVSSGFYRIWVKNVTGDGLVSEQSPVVTVEVTQPLFFRVGTVAINYASVIVTLLGLLLLMVFVFGWTLLRLRKWQSRQGKEISEAEKTVHQSFDTLKEGLAAYVAYIREGASRGEKKHREETSQRELKKDLEELEKGIQKEISDIKKK